MTTTTFVCGAECGLAGSIGQHFTLTGTGSFSTTTVRNGARSMRVNPTAGVAYFRSGSGYLPSGTTHVTRVAIRWATLPTSDSMVAIHDYGGSLAGAGFQLSDSKLYSTVKIAGVFTFGATGVSVTTDTWYYIDIKTVGSVVTGTADIQVNATACGQATGAFASANCADLFLGAQDSETFDAFYDDVVVSQTAGDYPLGNGYVWAYVPTSDGTHNVASAGDFDRTLTGTDITNSTTDAYLLVDAIPFIATDISAVECITITAPPNATDYVQCVFGPAPSSSTAVDTVHGVEVIGALQTASAGGSPTMDLSLRINDGGTTGDVFTSSVFYQPSTPLLKRAHFAVAPSTSTAWTAAKVNALQARFGSFDAADSAPDGYFGTIMAEVAFITIAVTPEQKNWIRTGHVPHMFGSIRHRIFGRAW